MKKYLKVKKYLLDKIQSGEYKLDKAIPSERDLAKVLEVNRMTVRKALDELMYDGLLIKKKGVGTFLTSTKKSKRELAFDSKEKSERTIKVLGLKEQTDGNYGYKVLKIPVSQPYWRLRRVRMLNLVPYAYEDIYFNKKYYDSVDKSFYEMKLRDMAKSAASKEDIVTMSETVESLLCLHNTAIILKVKTGSPVLQVKTHFIIDDDIIMSSRSYHPGDNYEYITRPRII